MVAPYEHHLDGEMAGLLDRCSLAGRPRAQVRDALVRARIGHLRIGACWMLRQRPGQTLSQQVIGRGLALQLAVMVGLLAVVYTFEIAGWSLIGNVTLNGRLDLGWMVGWVLMLATLAPLQSLSGWLEQRFALNASLLMKQRSFAGALNLDLDSLRGRGVGQLLGRVFEAQALEALALNGGMSLLVGMVELVLAMGVLAAGAAGGLHVALLLGWLTVNLALSWRYIRTLSAWTRSRLDLTEGLIESMIGRRTRILQQNPERRTREDDAALSTYFDRSVAMDSALTPLLGLMANGWLLLALGGLAPALYAGVASPTGLAISLGGILLGNRALGSLSGGLSAVARAGFAWGQVADLFRAASTVPGRSPWVDRRALARDLPTGSEGRLADISRVSFRHSPSAPPVLDGVDLAIGPDERILLCGESGSGKSTLASMLNGLRQPDSGLILLSGLDRETLGPRWNDLACAAPQFHENHIISGPLGLNLLMGRGWPASDADIADALEVCDDLGLTPLIDRMPGGLTQMVGETGWQLSHGEQSRIFLARALLQRAPLTILDESFAALDPETLHLCAGAARKHARSLVVIAHP
jgi:ATP-binding cassette subfamily B protein